MGREYPTHPRVGVGAIVWRDDRVLMIRRAKPPAYGEWSLPGGELEVGETLFDAAVREVREETGIDCRPVAVVDTVDGITRDDTDRVRFHYVIVDVAARWIAGEPRPLDDALDARWMTVAEVEAHAYYPEIPRVVGLSKARMAEREA